MFYCCISYEKPSYEDDGISIGDMPMPKNSTTEALEALGTSLDFLLIFGLNFWTIIMTLDLKHIT